MATLIIVHGGWGGGWEWTPVARLLRQRGHEVFTPTLCGLGERAHVRGEITLSDHIEDVLAVLEFEELDDVILCGHSSGGMVVTGVADRSPQSIRLLVYLDAFVPRDGEALRDLIPGEFTDAMLQSAAARADGRIVIPDELLPPEGVISSETRQRYMQRQRPHPAGTLTEKLRLTGAVERLPRAYVRCTVVDPDDLLGPSAGRARSEGWIYRELPSAHDLHLLDPRGTVDVLDGLAGSK